MELVEEGDLQSVNIFKTFIFYFLFLKNKIKFLNEYEEMKKKIPEELIWNIFYQIMSGLNFLHSKMIIHRDIKLLNILIAKDLTIKITDFGLSKTLETYRAVYGSHVGTPVYMAPELSNDSAYNNKIDIWSVGVTIYQLATNDFPFKANNPFALMNKIIKEPHIKISPNSSYSNDLIKCIDLLLSKDPKARPTFEEALELIPKDFLIKSKQIFFSLSNNLIILTCFSPKKY